VELLAVSTAVQIAYVVALVAVHCVLVTSMRIQRAPPRQVELTGDNIKKYEQLMNNKDFMKAQIACVMGEGPCDMVGKRVRILGNEDGLCSSCNQDEKANVKKVIKHVQTNYPNEWTRIVAKYGFQAQAQSSAEFSEEES